MASRGRGLIGTACILVGAFLCLIAPYATGCATETRGATSVSHSPFGTLFGSPSEAMPDGAAPKLAGSEGGTLESGGSGSVAGHGMGPGKGPSPGPGPAPGPGAAPADEGVNWKLIVAIAAPVAGVLMLLVIFACCHMSNMHLKRAMWGARSALPMPEKAFYYPSSPETPDSLDPNVGSGPTAKSAPLYRNYDARQFPKDTIVLAYAARP